MMKSILATLLLVWFTVGNCMAESLKPDTVPAVKEEVKKGWCLVCVDGFSMGWGKMNGVQIKNHYPKGLRRPY